MNHLRVLWMLPAALSVPAQVMAAESGFGLQFSPVLRMLGGLGVVLGLMLGVYGLLRNRLGTFSAGRKRVVYLLESCSLGSRRSVCLVRVRDREFLLGVTQQQISLLGELSPDGEEQEPLSSDDFGSMFKSLRREAGK